MSNYLELKVPIRWDAVWFRKLREAVAAERFPEKSVSWQRKYHHITAAFINNDEPVGLLADVFDRILSTCEPPMLTFDNVDAFIAKNAPVIIVNLTSTKPSPVLMSLIESLRDATVDIGTEIDGDFLLHVTLGRIDARTASVEQVKRIADCIQVPPFSLPLNEAEYRYYRGRSIRSWIMEQQPFGHNMTPEPCVTIRKN